MKTYEALLMSTHNICFRGEIRKYLSGQPSYIYLELWWFAVDTTVSIVDRSNSGYPISLWQPGYCCSPSIYLLWLLYIWASTPENVPSDMCAQRRFRSACAFAQSDQNLPSAHFGLPRMQSFFMRTTMTLISPHRCAGWFECVLRTCQKVRFLTLWHMIYNVNGPYPHTQNMETQIINCHSQDERGIYLMSTFNE